MATTIILLVILFLVLAAVVSVMVSTLVTGTPPMPTSPIVLPTAVSAVRASLPAPDAASGSTSGPDTAAASAPPASLHSRRRPVVLDAGCGWGTLVMALAASMPGIEVRGIERSFVPCLYARARAALFNRTALSGQRAPGSVPPRVSVRCVDLFQESLEDVDVLVTYLSTGHMERLKQIEDRLPPVLVSVAFALPERRPAVTYRVDDPYHTPVYVYRL